MAFWNKKSEDPWDIDPNRKREPVSFYERDLESQPEPERDTAVGLAEPMEEEPIEEAPDCPWCQQKMIRAYLVGGRDRLRLSDQKPTAFFGTLGHNVIDFNDDGFWTAYKSCWQCKACRKVVAEILDPVPEDSFARWDGNPVAPYSPEKEEKKE